MQRFFFFIMCHDVVSIELDLSSKIISEEGGIMIFSTEFP